MKPVLKAVHGGKEKKGKKGGKGLKRQKTCLRKEIGPCQRTTRGGEKKGEGGEGITSSSPSAPLLAVHLIKKRKKRRRKRRNKSKQRDEKQVPSFFRHKKKENQLPAIQSFL